MTSPVGLMIGATRNRILLLISNDIHPLVIIPTREVVEIKDITLAMYVIRY
jgi:hypothetical protein